MKKTKSKDVLEVSLKPSKSAKKTSPKKPGKKTAVKSKERSRLIAGKDFVLARLKFTSKEEAAEVSDDEARAALQDKLNNRKCFSMFSTVPVSPFTRVFQIVKPFGPKPIAYEVARSATFVAKSPSGVVLSKHASYKSVAVLSKPPMIVELAPLKRN